MAIVVLILDEFKCIWESNKSSDLLINWWIVLKIYIGLHLRSIEEPASRNSSRSGSEESKFVGSQHPGQSSSCLPIHNSNLVLGKGGGSGSGGGGVATEVVIAGSPSTTELQLPCNNPGISPSKSYDAEYARMESWMDENQEFVQDYFMR